jgi:hypothetical protein
MHRRQLMSRRSTPQRGPPCLGKEVHHIGVLRSSLANLTARYRTLRSRRLPEPYAHGSRLTVQPAARPTHVRREHMAMAARPRLVRIERHSDGWSSWFASNVWWRRCAVTPLQRLCGTLRGLGIKTHRISSAYGRAMGRDEGEERGLPSAPMTRLKRWMGCPESEISE